MLKDKPLTDEEIEESIELVSVLTPALSPVPLFFISVSKIQELNRRIVYSNVGVGLINTRNRDQARADYIWNLVAEGVLFGRGILLRVIIFLELASLFLIWKIFNG